MCLSCLQLTGLCKYQSYLHIVQKQLNVWSGYGIIGTTHFGPTLALPQNLHCVMRSDHKVTQIWVL
jgi:hypothetical protein